MGETDAGVLAMTQPVEPTLTPWGTGAGPRHPGSPDRPLRRPPGRARHRQRAPGRRAAERDRRADAAARRHQGMGHRRRQV